MAIRDESKIKVCRVVFAQFLSALLVLATNAFAVEKKKIDFVVGVDGDFKAAIAAAGASGASEANHFVIFFPDGEYEITKLTGDEHGKTTFSPSHVSIVGQSVDKTIVWNTTDTEGIGTTATLYFPKNNDMYMQDITLQNRGTYNSGNASRQVALQQNEGDKFVYKNVRLLSGQDTYYTKKGRAYWEGGEINGTVDFICGGGDVFFEGTKLVVTRSGGIITASQNPGDWGYVFNNTTLVVSNGSFNGTFYLGRSWGHAKTIFLNTRMEAQPKAEGWGDDMNSAPQVFGEYNSKNASGGTVNTSQRRTIFGDGYHKTVWDANDAAPYTLANVLKGSDNWDPTKLTAQVNAPKIEQEGAEIVWANDDNARAWVVFVNGKYKANVTVPSFSLEGVAVGSKVTVRGANSMGGLGSSSNEVTTLESNVTYYNVAISEPVGGSVKTNLTGSKAAQGKEVTFTAEPLEGWTFAGWTGKNAPTGSNASATTIKITATADIELSASFAASGTTVFQAETGLVENAIYESTNAGFAGTGYINFGTGTSWVRVPVYAEVSGEYKLTLTYANGSNSPRSLSIQAEGSEAQELSFENLADWKTYETKDLDVVLPKGASYITFSTVGGNDGPNLDQLELKLTKAYETAAIKGAGWSTKGKLYAKSANTRIRLFSTSGKLLRESVGGTVDTKGLNSGVYLLQVRDGFATRSKMIRVK